MHKTWLGSGSNIFDYHEKANEEKLKELAEQLEKAKESEGEVEILDARTAKADFYFLIGDKAKCIEAINAIPVESMSTGTKIDAELKHIRVGLFHMDKDILKQKIEGEGFDRKGWRLGA